MHEPRANDRAATELCPCAAPKKILPSSVYETRSEARTERIPKGCGAKRSRLEGERSGRGRECGFAEICNSNDSTSFVLALLLPAKRQFSAGSRRADIPSRKNSPRCPKFRMSETRRKRSEFGLKAAGLRMANQELLPPGIGNAGKVQRRRGNSVAGRI